MTAATLAALAIERGTGWTAAFGRIGALWALALLLCAHDVADIVTIWWTSSTFGHCLLIPPIIGWSVWQRREGLARLTPISWAPGLLVAAAGAGGWLLGQAAGVALARHAGLVLMLAGSVVAMTGPAVTRALAFPLGYAAFLVPAGDQLVPPLQTLTAHMVMALLRLTGVPATIDGVFITIPNGWFEVAEACSGVSFLIAMAAYGALVANVCFTSWPRRIGFMALALAAPVLANGLRAWATIQVAHLTSVETATGFDHIVYGWFFFAIVMAVVTAIGWRFFDRRPGDAWFDPERLPAGRPRDPWRTALAAAAIMIAPVAWSGAVAAQASPLPARIALPLIAGWQRAPITGAWWRPVYTAPDHSLFGRYRDAAGHQVDLAIIVFARQVEGRELVGFGQGAIGENSNWGWAADTIAPAGGRSQRITGPAKLVREVASFYRVGDVTTGSDLQVKIQTMKARLIGGSQRAVAVFVSAEEHPGRPARPAIDAFLADLGPIDALVDRTLAGPR